MNDEAITPPPISQTDFPQSDGWFYVEGGARRGPVAASLIKSAFQSKEIGPDTQMWRKGMTEWKSLKDSDLADLVASEPPSISSHSIGNGYAWVLALLPLVWGVIDASIAASNVPNRGLPVQIPLVINALFGWLDERRLRKAGYGSRWMRAAAVLLAPIYLFLRARRLKQRPWYAICWIITFLLGIALVAAAQTGL